MNPIVVHLEREAKFGLLKGRPECGRFMPITVPSVTTVLSAVTCGLCKQTVRFRELSGEVVK